MDPRRIGCESRSHARGARVLVERCCRERSSRLRDASGATGGGLAVRDRSGALPRGRSRCGRTSGAAAARPASTIASSAVAIAWPISAIGWRTVVSGGRRGGGQRDVVEADERDVVGHPPAPLAQRLQRAERHEVVRDEDAVEVRARRRAASASRGGRPRPRSRRARRPRARRPSAASSAAEALEPVDGGGHVERAGDRARSGCGPRSTSRRVAARAPPWLSASTYPTAPARRAPCRTGGPAASPARRRPAAARAAGPRRAATRTPRRRRARRGRTARTARARRPWTAPRRRPGRRARRPRRARRAGRGRRTGRRRTAPPARRRRRRSSRCAGSSASGRPGS